MDDASPDSEQSREARANELYWSSDRSVNGIAADLDVSKGTLYGLIQPHPADIPCPECGAELGYANRTARDRGLVTCPECGLEEEEDLVLQAWRETAESAPTGSVVVDGRRAPGAGRATAPGMSEGGGRIVLGGALLAVAAGVALALWARRR